MVDYLLIVGKQPVMSASVKHDINTGDPSLPSTHKKGDEEKDFLDITALVRSIQRADGNPDCFRRAEDYCAQLGCDWRKYCLEGENNHDNEKNQGK